MDKFTQRFRVSRLIENIETTSSTSCLILNFLKHICENLHCNPFLSPVFYSYFRLTAYTILVRQKSDYAIEWNKIPEWRQNYKKQPDYMMNGETKPRHPSIARYFINEKKREKEKFEFNKKQIEWKRQHELSKRYEQEKKERCVQEKYEEEDKNPEVQIRRAIEAQTRAIEAQTYAIEKQTEEIKKSRSGEVRK